MGPDVAHVAHASCDFLLPLVRENDHTPPAACVVERLARLDTVRHELDIPRDERCRMGDGARCGRVVRRTEGRGAAGAAVHLLALDGGERGAEIDAECTQTCEKQAQDGGAWGRLVAGAGGSAGIGSGGCVCGGGCGVKNALRKV